MRDHRFAALHDQIKLELEMQLQMATSPDATILPRCWSTIAWAYATMQVPDLDLRDIFNVIAQLSVLNLAAFKSFELMNLLWAFAKVHITSTQLFHAAHSYVGNNLASFSRSNLTSIVWAMVTAQQYQSSMLRRIAERFVKQRGAEKVSSVELANLMWGLATANVHTKLSVFQHIGNEALELLQEFKPQELSITAWAFSRMDIRHDHFFFGVALRLCQERVLQKQIHAQGMANLLWAFNRQKELDSNVVTQFLVTVQALLPHCLQLLRQFNLQEFFSVFQALQKFGFRWGVCSEADSFFLSAASLGVPSVPHAFRFVNLLEMYVDFLLDVEGSNIPKIFITFIAEIERRCIAKLPELGPHSAMHLLKIMICSTHLSRDLHEEFSGIIAALALQLYHAYIPETALNQLATMCGISDRPVNVTELQVALLKIATYHDHPAVKIPPVGINTSVEVTSVVGTSRFDSPAQKKLSRLSNTQKEDEINFGMFAGRTNRQSFMNDMKMPLAPNNEVVMGSNMMPKIVEHTLTKPKCYDKDRMEMSPLRSKFPSKLQFQHMPEYDKSISHPYAGPMPYIVKNTFVEPTEASGQQQMMSVSRFGSAPVVRNTEADADDWEVEEPNTAFLLTPNSKYFTKPPGCHPSTLHRVPEEMDASLSQPCASQMSCIVKNTCVEPSEASDPKQVMTSSCFCASPVECSTEADAYFSDGEGEEPKTVPLVSLDLKSYTKPPGLYPCALQCVPEETDASFPQTRASQMPYVVKNTFVEPAEASEENHMISAPRFRSAPAARCAEADTDSSDGEGEEPNTAFLLAPNPKYFAKPPGCHTRS